MILKNYKDFKRINEHTSYTEDELYNLSDMGLKQGIYGDLEPKSDVITIKIFSHMNGKLIYDLSHIEDFNVGVYARDVELYTFEGLPKMCNYFNGSNTNVETLEGGPTEVLTTYKVSDNLKLTSLEGSPFECPIFIASNTGIKNLKGLDLTAGGMVHMSLVSCTKLESLIGMTEYVNDLDIRECSSLIDLKYINTGTKRLLIEGCSKLNTLYDIRHLINEEVVHNLKVYDTQITETELNYYSLNFGKNSMINDYWKGLFDYSKHTKSMEVHNIYFPEEFTKTLNNKDQKLLRSSKTIGRFKL